MNDEYESAIEAIRIRNGYRMIRRQLNEAAGLVGNNQERRRILPSASEDIAELLKIVDILNGRRKT